MFFIPVVKLCGVLLLKKIGMVLIKTCFQMPNAVKDDSKCDFKALSGF